MNKVIFMGRLTKDPEIRYSQDGKAIAKFSLAVDRFSKNDEADFFNCTAFGKQGEFVEKYLKKGTKVLLSGRIQNDSYTNRYGQKVNTMQVIVAEIEFAENKKVQEEAQPPKDTFMPIPDDIDSEELPFNF